MTWCRSSTASAAVSPVQQSGPGRRADCQPHCHRHSLPDCAFSLLVGLPLNTALSSFAKRPSMRSHFSPRTVSLRARRFAAAIRRTRCQRAQPFRQPQELVKKSIDALGVKHCLMRELTEIGWPESDSKPLSSNIEGSLNQTAFVMQKLRSDMGDVHGTKPIISALVYDSIKWSSLLLRVLSIR